MKSHVGITFSHKLEVAELHSLAFYGTLNTGNDNIKTATSKIIAKKE